MTDVCGLVGIDARVLDNNFPGRFARLFFLTFSALFFPSPFPERGAIEIGVEVPGTGDFHTSDAFDFAKPIGDFLRDDARSFFEALRQLKADRRGGFAHFDFGRAIEHDIHGDGVVLLDVAHQGFAQATG
jgi:hypothetical protein